HLVDGGFIPTPPSGEAPAPSDNAPDGLAAADGGGSPAPVPELGQAPRGSTSGVQSPPRLPLSPSPPPELWHPRGWDIHICLGPNGTGNRSGIVDPFGTAPFGDRSPFGQPSPRAWFYYQDPAAYQDPAFRYDLILDMGHQPDGNDGRRDDIQI